MDSVGHDNYPAHTQLLANIHRMFVSNSAWSKVYGHGPTLHKHAGSQYSVLESEASGCMNR